MQNAAHDCMVLFCAESFIIFFLISQYDLDIYVETDVKHLGPVVQSIITLTSSLVVKMLTVPVSKISNSQVFLLKKCE